MLEVSADLGTMTVMEGLTEDAVYARLHEGGWVCVRVGAEGLFFGWQ